MSSSLCGKVEADIEIKASPSDFLYMVTHKPHHLPNASSDKIQGCDLREGEWGSVGLVVFLNYFHDGKARVSKQRIDAIDKEKNSMTYSVLEGDLMEHFKSFVVTIVANPKPDGSEGSVVHWTMEYEKHHEEIIDPHTLLQFAVDLTKDIEAHLVKDN